MLASEEGVVEEETLSPVISLNALAGIPSLIDYNTIRVNGFVMGKKMHILIDSGCTHNFLDSYIAEKLGCETVKCSPVKVIVANGETIQCDKLCSGLKFKMQGVEFQADLLILPLEGCQVVLGIQWLVLLGPIMSDFSQLRMEFSAGNIKIVLRGSPQPRIQLI